MFAVRGLLALVVPVAMASCAPSARPPPPARVSVHIDSSDEPIHTELVPVGIDEVPHVLTCDGPCAGTVWTGTYRLRAEGPGVAGLDRKIVITEPTNLRVQTGSSFVRDFGLVLALASMVIGTVSFIELLNCSFVPEHEPQHSCGGWLVGLGAAVVGTSTGWIMVGTARSHLLVWPSHPSTANEPLRPRGTSTRPVVGWQWSF